MAYGVRPPTAAEVQLRINLIEANEVVSAGSTFSQQLKDANVITSESATIDTAWDIAVISDAFNRPISAALTATGAGEVSGGKLRRVSDGACTLKARSALASAKVDVTMARTGGATTHTWQSWATGTLAKHIADTLPSPSTNFSRSTGWASSFDWRPFVVGSTAGSIYHVGFCAIGPRHIIGCEHGEFMPDTVTIGGVTRNKVSATYIGPSNSLDNKRSDLLVGLYDGDFPAYSKVVPANFFTNKLPSTSIKRSPCICTDQYGDAFIGELGAIDAYAKQLVHVWTPNTAYSKYIVPGGSGSPTFVNIGGELILLGTWTYGGGGSYVGAFTPLHLFIDEINAAMSPYSLTQVDLSGYPTYA